MLVLVHLQMQGQRDRGEGKREEGRGEEGGEGGKEGRREREELVREGRFQHVFPLKQLTWNIPILTGLSSWTNDLFL